MVSPSFSEGEMEPRRSKSAREDPEAGAGEIDKVSSSVSPSKISNFIPRINRRIINSIATLFVLIIIFGIVASGSIIQPLNIVDSNLDRSVDDSSLRTMKDTVNDSTVSDNKAEAGNDASNRIYKPPVDSKELIESNYIELEKAGSYTVEMSTEIPNSQNQTNYVSNVQSKFEYDLTNDRVLAIYKYSYSNSEAESRVVYGSDDTLYKKTPQNSSSNRYEKGDFSLSTWRERESDIIMTMSHIDLDYAVVDTDYHYTLQEPGEVPSQLYEDYLTGFYLYTTTGQAKLVEFEAVVSNKGVLQEYSYKINVTKNEEVYTFTRSIKVNDIGDTTVEEPAWIDEARAATD